ncbi:hypothetical protein CR513_55387, partial [Mucuna pruriens]
MEEGSTEPQTPLKRSWEADPDPLGKVPERAGAGPSSDKERRANGGLVGSELREAKAKNQLHQLQERIILLEAGVARGKLHNERLEKQRRQRLMELVSERKKAADLELQVKNIVHRLRGEADKYAEIANGAHKAAQEAREETKFWKE